MIDRLRGTVHPEGYHGLGLRAPYFEGWYFKVFEAVGQRRYAVIPGVSLSEGSSRLGPHSFVQVLDGVTGATSYLTYPLEAFSASPDALDVRIGPNHFTARGMTLDLGDADIPLAGHIGFIDPQPWPVKILSPGIMGWYAWVPRMECYHGVLSLDHGLSGCLQTGAGTVDFERGRGYIEKDWGRAFPSAWVWMQTNHFERPGTCLTASIARIPWLGRSFPGFIVGLLVGGELHRFATYTGARTTMLTVSSAEVAWALEDTQYRLELVGHRAETGALRGPSTADMARPVPETLSGSVDVTLTRRRNGSTVFAGSGSYAGMEIVGSVRELGVGQRTR